METTMSAWQSNQGGGFMNATGSFDSPSAKPKKDGVRRPQSLIPLCARQINHLSGESDFQIFNYRVQMIYVVGIVKEIQVTSTKIHYTIEDHTGSITALWWLEATDTGEDNTSVPDAKEGAYVQLFGTIKKQDGNKVVMVLKMFLVEDANIITTHLLEVINTRLQAQHNRPAVASKPRVGADLANSMAFLETGESTAPNLTAVQQKIHDIIKADQTMNGVSTSSILSHFPQNQKNEAKEGLEFLINEGHAYSTVDNDHFKATDSN